MYAMEQTNAQETTIEEKHQELKSKNIQDKDLNSEDIDLLLEYEAVTTKKQAAKVKQEKYRSAVALERIAEELKLYNKIELLKLYMKMVGPNITNELECELEYNKTQEADYSFNHFVEVVKKLGQVQDTK
jgi:hypothetical protein